MKLLACLIVLAAAACGGDGPADSSNQAGARVAAAERIGPERRMEGMFTALTEGTQFQECPDRAPWRCFESKSLPCAMAATGQAQEAIGAALGKVGGGYATFRVELVGRRAEGGLYGHVGGWLCEIRTSRILSIRPAPDVPPDMH